MAAVRFRKEVPAAHMLDNMANGRKGKERGAAERRVALHKAILDCVGGDMTRLSSYETKLKPSREEVLARLPNDLNAPNGWPRISTIRNEIRDLKRNLD
jgi:hypothetical protein